jgi:hypothetical protein
VSGFLVSRSTCPEAANFRAFFLNLDATEHDTTGRSSLARSNLNKSEKIKKHLTKF